MGMSVNITNIPYMAYIQENLPKQKQGRGISLYQTLISIAMPIGLTLAGPVSEMIGVSYWFLAAGIGMILCIAFSKFMR